MIFRSGHKKDILIDIDFQHTVDTLLVGSVSHHNKVSLLTHHPNGAFSSTHQQIMLHLIIRLDLPKLHTRDVLVLYIADRFFAIMTILVGVENNAAIGRDDDLVFSGMEPHTICRVLSD